ncbi:MAG: hypothetical protein JSS34_04145 [Proteobacteria bacterium]|nr:hypothetical protein [Pseudomonadota bacterium]
MFFKPEVPVPYEFLNIGAQYLWKTRDSYQKLNNVLSILQTEGWLHYVQEGYCLNKKNTTSFAANIFTRGSATRRK